jgi:uncharacterized protein YecE (DUF72 family)
VLFRSDTVEVYSPAGRLPRPETAERWRAEAPRGFVYSLPVAPAVAENRFRDVHDVREAWEQTAAVAQRLAPGFLVFETPHAFYPNADHLRDMYAFFRSIDRGGAVCVWHPSRGWDPSVVGRVCRDLRLVRAVDPLSGDEPVGAVNYFRLRGAGPGRKPSRGHRYSDGELKAVADRAGGKPTYAYFLTADGWIDARRLKRLVDPMTEVMAKCGRGARITAAGTRTPPRSSPPRGGGE